MTKTGWFLLFFIGYASCTQVDKQGSRRTAAKGAWQIYIHTVSSNRYNSHGLPDTIVETSYMFNNGELMEKSTSVRTREYDDRNNLVREKEISLPERNERQFMAETISSFDAHNRMTTRIRNWYGKEIDRSQYGYDRSGFLIRLIDMGANSKEMAGSADPDKATWDTSISTFINDGQGNAVKVIVKKPDNDELVIVTNLYANRQRISSYSLNKNADTTETISYAKDGRYEREIDDHKDYGRIDTTWREDGRIHKLVDNNLRRRNCLRTIYKYDSKGNQTESTTYRSNGLAP